MNQYERVFLDRKPLGLIGVDAALIQASLESVGIRDIKFKKRGQNYGCVSSYAVGQFEGTTVGVRFGRQSKEIYQREEECLSRLSHPGIPQCIGVGDLDTPLGIYGYMIIDHFDAVPLNDILDLSTEDGKDNFRINLLGLVDLIDYIHSQGIVHQDISIDHVLVNNAGTICLIDFHLWDDAAYYPATSDFCGLRHIPSLIEKDYVASPRLLEYNEILAMQNPEGFGILLKELLEYKDPKDSFIKRLKIISDYLTGRSDDFVWHPKSRDFVSKKVKEMLVSA